MKTIKQIADDLGISKQAVRKQVDKLPQTLVSTDSKNTILINDDGVKIICEKVSSRNTKVCTNKVQTVDTLVDMLQKELSSKNAQLESQSRQLEAAQQTIKDQAQSIQKLTDTLGYQQALHAGTIHTQKQLTGITLERTEEQPAAVEESQNLNFWDKLRQLFK